MKRSLLYCLIFFTVLAFWGAATSFAAPPEHVSVPEHVKEKQAAKDQDKDMDQDKDIDQEEYKEEDTPNTSKIGHVGRAGKSHVGHMYLFEKNATTWKIVEDGAWGKMRYTVEGPEFDFVFNGHGLDSGRNYTLIYYPDPWPGNGTICLGKETATEEGDLHIMGSSNIEGGLPQDYDANANPSDDEPGAKIWLVLTEDVNCDSDTGEMSDWNPSEYLFEYDLIEYNETNGTENKVNSDTESKAQEGSASGKMPAIIRSDMDIFIPEAQIFDRSASFKLEYWKNPNDEEGIYFKLDKNSLTIDE